MATKKNTRAKGLRGQALRDFKHSVSILKKEGLVRKTTDARKQKPTRYMRAKVEALRPVILGKAGAIRRTGKVFEEYKEAGFRTVAIGKKRPSGYVLVERDTYRKIKKSRQSEGEYMTIRRFMGSEGDTVIEEVIMPATVQNIDDFMEALRSGQFDDLKRPEDFWAFQFYGNNSSATFKTSELLHDFLQFYKTLQEGGEGSWKHFVLYRVYPPGVWLPQGGPAQQDRRRRRGKKTRTIQDRRQAGGRISAMSHETMLELDARRHREARAKETPAQREKRLAGNRASMRLAREEEYKKQGKKPRKYSRRKP